MTRTTPLVSILIPVYNVEGYLRQCLEAVLSQTLHDIEVIALDDGSTDSSPGILSQFARDDTRLRVITKANEGYGATINRGVREARSDYIGIIEPDDYPEPTMFEKLHHAAKRFNADLVKCDFIDMSDEGESTRGNLSGLPHGVVFDPADHPEAILITPSIWAALYRKEMLQTCGIRCRETPGAAFQDTSFTLKCLFAARRCVLLGAPLLHYRRDNPDSSTLSTDKVQVVADEFACARDFLRRDPIRCRQFISMLRLSEWRTHCWDFTRIAPSARKEYLARIKGEFSDAQDRGDLDRSLFRPAELERLDSLLNCSDQKLGEFNPAEGASPLECLPLLKRTQGITVSVVVTAYQNADHIARALNSCLTQTHRAVQVICVDDGSTDETPLILEEIAGRDPRVHVVHMPQNSGTHSARLAGIREASGALVTFLDGDDELDSRACTIIAGAFAGQPYDILQFGIEVLSDGSAPSAQVRSMEKWVRPPKRRIEAREVFEYAFFDYAYCANVAGKAFRTELALGAMESLGELRADYGEDNMEYFAISSRAKSYRGLPGSKLYRYHFGNGQSSMVNINATQFERPLRIVQAIEGIRDFLERTEAEAYQWSGFEQFRKRQLEWLLDIWNDYVCESAKQECLSRLLGCWPHPELVDAICERGFDAVALLRECLPPEERLSSEQLWRSGYIDGVRATRNEYEQSASYRLGRTLTSVARWIKGKC